MRILLRILVKVYKGQWKDCKWVKFQRANFHDVQLKGLIQGLKQIYTENGMHYD